ncbi:MAG: hypothetical protein Kow0090_15740 [Myxococcota bacterium]
MKQAPSEIFRVTKPFDDMEIALVQDSMSQKEKDIAETVAVIRYALNLARLTHLPVEKTRIINLTEQLESYRRQIEELLSPLLIEIRGKVDYRGLMRLAPKIKQLVHGERARLLRNNINRFNKEALDNEICQKSLVLVLGGGGGVGYIYLGAFKALEDAGLKPAYIVATSMGATMGMFRAKSYDFRWADVVKATRVLQWRKLISFISMKSRFGLPGYMKLHLYSALSRYFKSPVGEDLRLCDLPIPLDVIVAGIKKGELKHDPDYYGHMLDSLYTLRGGRNLPYRKARGIMRELISIIGEFFSNSTMLREIVMGGDELTSEIKVLDAVGFSCALPAVIHYDIARDDRQAIEQFERLMEAKQALRLIDGGMIDNVPTRVAWEGVYKGRLPTRNVCIVSFDSFAPRPLQQPLWLPLQRLAAQQSRRNKPFSHIWHSFLNTLSPMEIIPDIASLRRIVDVGYDETKELTPFIKAVIEPLPGLEGEYKRQEILIGA